MTPTNVVARADASALPVLALDIATRCGWALRTSATISSGTQDFAERRNETRGQRLHRFVQWLGGFQSLSLVAYERVQGHMQGPAQSCYAQFEGVLLYWCARRAVPVKSVPVATLKKAITGTGRATKAQMIDAMTQLGFTPSDDNEADALAVLHWATS